MAALQGPIEQPYDDQWQGLLATVHSFDLEFFFSGQANSKMYLYEYEAKLV